MELTAKILIGVVALEHLGFLWLEMFAWETTGKKAFKGALAPELFKPTKTLAANQGLYNGFLAAGLIWTFFIADVCWSQNVGIFFLTCVILAALYGGLSASKKIFFIQGIPALLAMTFLLLSIK
jgi:putative membrane protein